LLKLLYNIILMSWGTKYTTSNNLNINFPGIIEDGRFFTDYSPSAVLNNKIKENNAIFTNIKYKEFLTKNATNIMNHNFKTSGAYDLGTNYPFMFNSVNDNSRPNGYESSLPKNLYLSREQLTSNQTRPLMSHFSS
jgi:hypothetical protein